VYAERNYRAYPFVEPNDQHYALMWHYFENGSGAGKSPGGVDLPAAWEGGQGISSVVVGMADSGMHTVREYVTISDLVDALQQLGVQVDSLGKGGCPPVRVRGGSLRGGRAVIDGSRSSQYVSGVLMAAPYAQQDVELSFLNGVLVSRPYVELTLQMMRAFGVEADWTSEAGLGVKAGQHYTGRDYSIEPDASAAVYPFCAAAITGGFVRVLGLPSDSIQADLALLPILEQMGCDVSRTDQGIGVQGPVGSLQGVDVDMNNLPDAALALAVVAAFARGPTHIRNVGNLRIKETDRLAALEHELCKLGASARTTQDSLTIEPGPLRAAGDRLIDNGGAEVGAVRLTSTMINTLPERGRVGADVRERLWRETAAQRNAGAEALARAAEVYGRCRRLVDEGRIFSLRRCLEREHDGMMLRLNLRYWQAIAGS
ncbi:MAG: hypothetical protein IIA00_05580, partial [Proteobacteria bacterium]|nr:hypothetical protein [Pseudomonadota bacterium]